MRIGLPQFVERDTALWMDVGVSLTLEASEIQKIKSKIRKERHDLQVNIFFKPVERVANE